MAEESRISSLVSKHFHFSLQRGVWTTAFIAALGFTLCEGSYLWLARLGWVLLAILFALHRRYAIYTIFFFATFFHTTGFLRHSPIALKHFHIACTLLIAIDILQGTFADHVKKGLIFLRAILPFVTTLALGCVVSLRGDFALGNFRTPFNVLLVLTFLYYLYSCVVAFSPEERLIIFRRSILAFSAGMAVQCVAAFLNHLFGASLWGITLFHNNHLGNLSLFAFFYVMPLYASSKKSLGKSFYFLILLVVFAGIVASCSRTAWFTTALCLCAFVWMSWRFLKKNIGPCAFHIHILPTIVVLILSFFVLMLNNHTIAARVMGLPKLLDLEYWKYTFADHQNFGFLGICRLEQYILLRDILIHHWLLGIGFVKKVVDMHGLLLVILGATGCIGFSLFLAFCIRHLVRIHRALSVQISEELLLMLTGSFCAFLGWLTMSFMLTLIVHFTVWINVMIGVLLVELSKDLGAKERDSGLGTRKAPNGTNVEREASCRNH